MLAEPTAGAMAYGLFVAGRKTVCVFDLGGGTFDASLLRIDEGTVEVLATHGDTRVGGSDIDKLVVEFALREVQQRRRRLRAERTSSSPAGGDTTADVARSLDTLALRRECEAAKIALSTQETAAIRVFWRRPAAAQLPAAAAAAAGPKGGGGGARSTSITTTTTTTTTTAAAAAAATATATPAPAAPAVAPAEECTVELTRAQLDAMCAPLFDRCMSSVEDCLREAGKTPEEVDEVVLVGGCTRMPELRRRCVHACVRAPTRQS